jgi:hypothetical protein
MGPKRDTPLVCDASVLINLIATDRAQTILAAIGRPRVIVDWTMQEVFRDPRDGTPARGFLTSLVRAGGLVEATLDASGLDLFLDLVGATPPDDLSDGEAAVIAHANSTGSAVVIDERKASRICRRRFPSIELLSTVDLFRNPDVQASLGHTLGDAIFRALNLARMGVPVEHREWVAKIVGIDRLDGCPSFKRTRYAIR